MTITVSQTFVLATPKGMIVGNAGDKISDAALLERLADALPGLIADGKVSDDSASIAPFVPIAVPAARVVAAAVAPPKQAAPAAADPALATLGRTALLALAKAEGVPVDRNANKATLISAITAHRAPPVADEIVPAGEEAPTE